MNDKEKIKTTYFRMIEGMINKDELLLSSVLSDNFELTHMTGLHQTKSEFIKQVLDGTLNYYESQPNRIDIKLDGNNAQLIGENYLKAAVYGGPERLWPLKFYLKLKKENDRWKITESSVGTF